MTHLRCFSAQLRTKLNSNILLQVQDFYCVHTFFNSNMFNQSTKHCDESFDVNIYCIVFSQLCRVSVSTLMVGGMKSDPLLATVSVGNYQGN